MTGVLLGMWQTSAEAAYSYTSAQTDPTPVQYTMRSAVTANFLITNTNTNPNTGARIYQVRFRLNTYNTTFPSTIAPPAGWTRTAYSTTSVTFRASSWANAIAVGSNLNFVILMTAGYSSADVTQHLRDVRAYYTTTTTGPPFTNLTSVTLNSGTSIGSWTLKSLEVTSFIITDLSGTPISTLTPGASFRLVMTVANRSTATLSTITTNPNPPTAVKTGTVTQALTSTVYSPNPLTLASGASGTITFTYSTNATDSGTIYFTAFARNSVNSATSIMATSPTLAMGQFNAGIAVTTSPATSPTCGYFNANLTVTMTLTNNFSQNIINVTPSALVVSVGGQVTLVSGPTPAAPNGPVPSGGGTFNFVWVYQITGSPSGSTFYFTGSANGTEQTGGSGTPVGTQTVNSNTVKFGGFTPQVNPTSINANSTDQEMTWSITNNGCADAKQVQITAPAGWGLPDTDSYSMIEQYNPPNPGTNPIDPIEDIWTVSGTNPVVFTATILPPSASTNVLPLVGISPKDGTFNLVFPTTPSSTGTSTFQITITDTNNASVTRTTDVTVNAFNSGSPGPNSNNTGATREDFP